MTSTPFTHQLSLEQTAYFDQIAPCYNAPLDGSSDLLVTSAAHDYYGLEPRMEVRPGRPEHVPVYDPRKPYAQIILAAPTEVGAREKDVYYEAAEGFCRFVVADPRTSEEYVTGGVESYCGLIRQQNPGIARTDAQIIAEMDPDTRSALFQEYRAGQVADFAKLLSTVLVPRVAYLREQSFVQDARRHQLHAQQGTTMTVLRDSGVESFVTLPNIITYAQRRYQAIGEKLIEVFCDPKCTFLLNED